MVAIVWFRQDLRLNDNPAVNAAADSGLPIVFIYIYDDETDNVRKRGGASKVYLNASLSSLQHDLQQKYGADLLFFKGKAQDVLADLCPKLSVKSVFWNRIYEPALIKRDTHIKAFLQDSQVEAHSFKAGLLFEPWEVQTGAGGFYKVFTPFWRECVKRLTQGVRSIYAPDQINFAVHDVASLRLEDLNLLPKSSDWSSSLTGFWSGNRQVGEQGAAHRLRHFHQNHLNNYHENRDIPSIDGTSFLSPALHFGEISPRQVFYFLQVQDLQNPISPPALDRFKTELGWREFSYHLLYHAQDFETQPFRQEFLNFQWLDDEKSLQAWQKGQTGVPIVDAGMRQLWQTGWMHNRVRMIVASFLTKHLLINWKAGEDWFWDTLVDADLANNVAGWQWTAGCGADAAPYFRVFNPVLQGERFDSAGHYIRQWVPELSNVPDKFIHHPHDCGRALDYPKPIIDLAFGRNRALELYAELKK